MNYMFQNCPYYVLKRIDLSSFNFKSTTISDMELIFSGGTQEIIIKEDSNFIPSPNMYLYSVLK